MKSISATRNTFLDIACSSVNPYKFVLSYFVSHRWQRGPVDRFRKWNCNKSEKMFRFYHANTPAG